MNHPANCVYLGLDVAKLTLACHLAGATFTVANDASGHRELCQRIGQHGTPVQVICEASGGYERAIARVLRHQNLSVTILHPTRARKLADGLGYLAKNDRLDARMLAELGALLKPPGTMPRSAAEEHLSALVQRRAQITALVTLETQHLETTSDKALRRDLAQSLAQLERRRAKLDALIEGHLAAEAELGAKARRLQEAPGVGPIGAVTLIALLPELGRGSSRSIISLAGLAPRDHQSGAFKGQRHVHGGRPKVRRILYLCALSAARHHPALRPFYLRLLSAGKAPKLALIATARKLLTYLHSALKDPSFSLAPN
jgi:transposase